MRETLTQLVQKRNGKSIFEEGVYSITEQLIIQFALKTKRQTHILM